MFSQHLNVVRYISVFMMSLFVIGGLANTQNATACSIRAGGSPNFRSSPGTIFRIVGSMSSNTEYEALGQTIGIDNFLWWYLGDGRWVRSDVVTEIGSCEAVPEGRENIPSHMIPHQPEPSGQFIYVDASASIDGDGSQQLPFNSIQQAINRSNHGDTIRVAVGTYTGAVNIRNKTVIIEGGYNPPTWTRTSNLHNTIIDREGRSRSVEISDGARVLLDGFVVTGVNHPCATGGAGFLIQGRNTHAIVSHTKIINNVANSPCGGGGVEVDGATAAFVNVVIAENMSANGAGINALQGKILLVNTTIVGNRPDAIDLQSGSQAVLINSLLWDNGQLLDLNRVTTIHSLSSTAPFFVNPTEYDYSLSAGSPAIHAGTTMGVPFIELMGDLSNMENINIGAFDRMLTTGLTEEQHVSSDGVIVQEERIEEAQPSSATCTIQTQRSQTVQVRVGPGTNRTSLTFLIADTVYEVIGQSVDDDVWFALNKEIGAPTKSNSLIDPYVWVAMPDVNQSGDCDKVDIITASGPRPFATATPISEITQPTTNEVFGTTSEAEATLPPVPRATGTFNLLLDPNIQPCPIIQPYGVNIYLAMGSGYASFDEAQAALTEQSTSISIDGQAMPVIREEVTQPGNGLFNFSTEYFWRRPLPGTYQIMGIEPNAVRTCTVIIES